MNKKLFDWNLCNIMNVTFDQFNANVLNKNINSLKKNCTKILYKSSQVMIVTNERLGTVQSYDTFRQSKTPE